MEEKNPYAAPASVVADVQLGDDQQLAERGTRLVAVIIDGLIFGLPILAAIAMTPGIFSEPDAAGQPPTLVIVFVSLWALVVLVVNLVLLYRYSQTIGKRVTKIKIVRTDGSRAGLGRILGLRMFVNGLPGALPCVGAVYPFVDALFIFRKDFRCVHDHIADTKVVKV